MENRDQLNTKYNNMKSIFTTILVLIAILSVGSWISVAIWIITYNTHYLLIHKITQYLLSVQLIAFIFLSVVNGIIYAWVREKERSLEEKHEIKNKQIKNEPTKNINISENKNPLKISDIIKLVIGIPYVITYIGFWISLLSWIITDDIHPLLTIHKVSENLLYKQLMILIGLSIIWIFVKSIMWIAVKSLFIVKGKILKKAS